MTINPGHHVLEARIDGSVVESLELELEEGTERTISFHTTSPPIAPGHASVSAAPQVTPARGSGGAKTGTIVAGALLAGAGAIVGVAGVAVYSTASSGSSSSKYVCFNDSGEDCRNITQITPDSGNQTVGAGLIVAGAVLVVGGVITMIVASTSGRPTKAASRPASVSLTPSPHGLTFQF